MTYRVLKPIALNHFTFLLLLLSKHSVTLDLELNRDHPHPEIKKAVVAVEFVKSDKGLVPGYVEGRVHVCLSCAGWT